MCVENVTKLGNKKEKTTTNNKTQEERNDRTKTKNKSQTRVLWYHGTMTMMTTSTTTSIIINIVTCMHILYRSSAMDCSNVCLSVCLSSSSYCHLTMILVKINLMYTDTLTSTITRSPTFILKHTYSLTYIHSLSFNRSLTQGISYHLFIQSTYSTCIQLHSTAYQHTHACIPTVPIIEI